LLGASLTAEGRSASPLLTTPTSLFSVPRSPKSQSLYEEKARIVSLSGSRNFFQSHGIYIGKWGEGDVHTHFYNSGRGLEVSEPICGGGGERVIFISPKVYLEEERSAFFQVPLEILIQRSALQILSQSSEYLRRAWDASLFSGLQPGHGGVLRQLAVFTHLLNLFITSGVDVQGI